MLKLSKMTDYAVVVLTSLADGETLRTTPGIANDTGVPEPTVAKVLKCLASRDLVVSQRGARGGYRLARPLHSILVADVVSALEGPIVLAACVQGSGDPCAVSCTCPVSGRWERVNEAVRAALASVNLAEMRAPTRPVTLPAE